MSEPTTATGAWMLANDTPEARQQEAIRQAMRYIAMRTGRNRREALTTVQAAELMVEYSLHVWERYMHMQKIAEDLLNTKPTTPLMILVNDLSGGDDVAPCPDPVAARSKEIDAENSNSAV